MTSYTIHHQLVLAEWCFLEVQYTLYVYTSVQVVTTPKHVRIVMSDEIFTIHDESNGEYFEWIRVDNTQL